MSTSPRFAPSGALALYAAYLKERRGFELLATDDAFITYTFDPPSPAMHGCCYIQDIYVAPHARRTQAGTALADEVTARARAVGIRTLLGTSQPSTHGSDGAIRAMLAYGFRIIEAHEDMLILRKEI